MSASPYPVGLVGLDFPDLSLESLFRFAAEHGLDHIDLYNRVNLTSIDAGLVEGFVKKYRVAVNSISSRAMPNTSQGGYADEVRLALESLEIAAQLNVPLSESMVGASALDLSDDEAIDQYLNRVEYVLDRAEILGITILIENVHDRDGGRDVTASLDSTLRLLERAQGRLRLCWDSGNYVVDDPETYDLTTTLDLVLPHTDLIQIKDVQPQDAESPWLEDTRLMKDPRRGVWQSTPTGDGRALASDVVAALRTRGWTKAVSVELFCSPARRDYYWPRSLDWLRQHGVL